MEQLVIGGIYRHYKGALYQVVAVSTHTEDGEDYAVYRSSHGKFWNRPLGMFTGINETGEKRFVLEANQQEAYIEYSNADIEIVSDEDSPSKPVHKKNVVFELTGGGTLQPLLLISNTKQLLDTMLMDSRAKAEVHVAVMDNPLHIDEVSKAVVKYADNNLTESPNEPYNQ